MPLTTNQIKAAIAKQLMNDISEELILETRTCFEDENPNCKPIKLEATDQGSVPEMTVKTKDGLHVFHIKTDSTFNKDLLELYSEYANLQNGKLFIVVPTDINNTAFDFVSQNDIAAEIIPYQIN